MVGKTLCPVVYISEIIVRLNSGLRNTQNKACCIEQGQYLMACWSDLLLARRDRPLSLCLD